MCVFFRLFSRSYNSSPDSFRVRKKKKEKDKENKLFPPREAENPAENGSLSRCVRAKR